MASFYGSHDNHPGFNSTSCPLNKKVTARPGSMSQNGYSCYWTGGHCLPSKDCEKWVKETERQEKIELDVMSQLNFNKGATK